MRKLILFFLIVSMSSCTKDTDLDEVFTNFTFSTHEVPADGQSTVNVSVELTKNSSEDRRSVIFKTSSGVFTSSSTQTAIVKAEYENGHIVAKTTLKVSTRPGDIVLSVRPEYDSPVDEFTLQNTIIAVPSVASSIQLESSALGIASNHLTEVKVIGTLKNSSEKFVSEGHKVIFQDFLSNGLPANGGFRDIHTVTGSDSTVSSYYSIGQYPIGTRIEIRCTILDYNDIPTSITDSVFLTINQ
jgi:hypothetical protein